jgi:Lrp/AsnC family leucine-responsive transcriptional regulator
MKQLDATDKKIIEILQNNGKASLKELSADIHMTTPAISARIERLERDGYIKGYHAEIDLEKTGFSIKAFILVSVRHEDVEKFTEFISSSKCVIECCHITGPYSMILKAVFSSTSLLGEFLEQIQYYGKTETQVVFSTLIDRP